MSETVEDFSRAIEAKVDREQQKRVARSKRATLTCVACQLFSKQQGLNCNGRLNDMRSFLSVKVSCRADPINLFRPALRMTGFIRSIFRLTGRN